MAESRERTAQEREAARRERERRRVAGAAAGPEGESFQPPGSDGSFAETDDGTQPGSVLPGPDEEPGGGQDGAVDGTYPDEPDGDDPAHLDGAELPSGTRRVSRLQAPAGQPRRRRAVRPRPAAPRRPPAPAGKRHSWVGRVASLIALVAAAALIWFVFELFQPLGTSPHGHVVVVVPSHSSSDRVGTLLEHDGVISSSFFFRLRATLAGDRSDLRAGTYHLQRDMSYSSVLSALTTAPPAARTSQLTITEGRTRAYVGALLRKQHVKGNYVAATRHSPLLDPTHYGAPRDTPSLEGFLFPDTFSLVDPVTVSALVADQLKDFKRRFAGVNLAYARRRHLTPYDVLKIASLIQSEAGISRDEPLISSVIYNRLHDGMMLQLDSTTRYATGNATAPLTESQLQSPSPYNTRTHVGLPPTPINSPGLSAIRAAAHPANTRYLYFFSKPCTSGSVYATNYTQFLNLLQSDKRTHC